MIAYSANCLISQEWRASIAEGDSIINATLLYFTAKSGRTWRAQTAAKADRESLTLYRILFLSVSESK